MPNWFGKNYVESEIVGRLSFGSWSVGKIEVSRRFELSEDWIIGRLDYGRFELSEDWELWSVERRVIGESEISRYKSDRLKLVITDKNVNFIGH